MSPRRDHDGMPLKCPGRGRWYLGARLQGEGCKVAVIPATDRVPLPLDPRFDLRNHSPTGFEWGYAGSGPAQLALALAADALGDDLAALAVYQSLKQILPQISVNWWIMGGPEILVACRRSLRVRWPQGHPPGGEDGSDGCIIG